jgi:hypothetical protein
MYILIYCMAKFSLLKFYNFMMILPETCSVLIWLDGNIRLNINDVFLMDIKEIVIWLDDDVVLTFDAIIELDDNILLFI